MTIAIDALLAVVFIAAGYIYACYYLNHIQWSEKNTDVLKLTKNKMVYLVCAVATAGCLIFLFQTLYMLNWIQSAKLLGLVLILFPIAAIDSRLQKIPNQLLIAALAFRALIYIPEFIISPSGAFMTLKDNLLGAAIISGFFLLLLLGFKNSIGMGDIKLFAVMGLYQGIWGAVNSVFFSLLVSFFVSVVLLITKKKSRKDTMSFGPSILIGTAIAIGMAGM